MHNLLSFLLGLAAWGFGLAAALKPAGRWLSHASFLACGISLVLQLAEVRRRVGLQDWAALLDTMDAVRIFQQNNGFEDDGVAHYWQLEVMFTSQINSYGVD